MNKKYLAIFFAAILAASSHAADKVKVGLITTLSGPNASIGIEIKDGFNLALKLGGGKLGGLPVELFIGDDQLNPEVGKQLADKNLKRDKVDFLTGIAFSNVMLAVLPSAVEAKVHYLSPNAAPSATAGAQCTPWLFAVSWPNDAYHEAAGKFATDRGFKSAYAVAANYQAGKDALNGFKRYYKGKLVDEQYTRLGQLDYAAELAQIRAAKPEALYVFLPGGMGVNFIKQFVAAGLSGEVTLILPGFGADDDIIRAVGNPMSGVLNTAHWAPDTANEANRKFVSAFEKEYKRIPSVFAAQAYDTALLMDSAVKGVGGKLDDKEALRKALKAARFDSVRGDFKFNTNQYPIQNYYVRSIGKDGEGRLANKTVGTVFTRHGDVYAADCPLK